MSNKKVNAIVTALEKSPYISVCVQREVVARHMQEPIGFNIRFTNWDSKTWCPLKNKNYHATWSDFIILDMAMKLEYLIDDASRIVLELITRWNR